MLPSIYLVSIACVVYLLMHCVISADHNNSNGRCLEDNINMQMHEKSDVEICPAAASSEVVASPRMVWLH